MAKWQVGDKIGGRFEIHQILGGEGKSGMGIVYVCMDQEDSSLTPIALKTLQNTYRLSEEVQKLFEHEAVVWTILRNHPYIVYAESVWKEIYPVEGKLEKQLFVILEYIPPDSRGRNTLTHYLGSLSYPEILKFSIQFCNGMEYAYSRGIVCHRDIKPDNIMITPDKTVKITDFGLARVCQEIELKEDIISTAEEHSFLSIFQNKGKRVCGTLPYMAPEQFDGYADRRSDVYAFGITLYQMVTGGRLPFIAATMQEYERLHKNESAPIIPSQIFPIIQRCLEKQPEARYQCFSPIREELQDLLIKETGENTDTLIPEIPRESSPLLADLAAKLNLVGAFEEAITYCDKAIEKAGNQRWMVSFAYYNKGLALHNLLRYRDAITCCDKVIEISLEYRQAPKLRGFERAAWQLKQSSFYHLGEYQEAINCYHKARGLTPEDAEKEPLDWLSEAIFLICQDRFNEALECIEEIIRQSPDWSEPHQLKQSILQKLRR